MIASKGRSFLLLLLPVIAVAYRVKIGVLSGPGSDRRQNSEKFWSFGRNQSSAVVLEPTAYEIPYWNTLEIIRTVCLAAKEGARALVVVQGPPRLAPLLNTYSEHLSLPLVLESPVPSDNRLQISLLPSTVDATAALLRHYQWNSFAFIYDTDHGADKLQEVLLSLGDPAPELEAFWRAYNAEEASAFARQLPVDVGRLLLDVSEDMADMLFNKLSASGRSFHGILIRPVGTVLRGSTQGITKLTKFSMVEEGSDLLKDLENRWKTLEDRTRRPSAKDLPDSVLLSHDASRVLHIAFSHLSREFPEALRVSVSPLVDCFNYSSGIPTAAQPFQRNVILGQGVTGNLQFDEQGRRKSASLNIIESTAFSLNKIGSWSDVTGLKLTEKIMPPVTAFQKRDLPIRVTSILSAPFLMENPDGSKEGYVADFLEQLSLVTGRRYQLQVVKDGRYGIFRNGQWNGMIGELVRNETDMVVADLTKTPERAQAVYFSKTFMTMGLNLMVHKPQELMEAPSTFGPFSFLAVWPVELWLMIVSAAALFMMACYGISRWVGAPDRVRALESKGTDSLSPCGSVWFTMGALLQRDTGIYPRSFTHRVWALLWWAFCFFVLVSYVSALSAALLRNRSHVISTYSQKTTQEVLEDLLQKGSPAIGVTRSGSSWSFFVNASVSSYRDFGRYLQEHPDVAASSRKEAVERVRNSGGGYAFVAESMTSEYIANRPPCDILSTPGYFTTRVFAPALHKNSPLKDIVDHGVLTLIENGTLRELYEKWWHNYTNQCEDPNMNILPKIYSQSMTLHEVSGVFFILTALAIISIGTAFVEYYITSSRMSLK